VAIDCLCADSFEGKSSVFSYLKSIANHKAIDLIRQQVREKVLFVPIDEADEAEAGYDDLEHLVVQIDLKRLWKICLALYPEEIWVLQLQAEGYTNDEIARKIGRTEGATKAFIYSCHQKFQKLREKQTTGIE